MAYGDDPRAAGVSEGQVLAGRYRVERVLGVGGMGAVVAARHLELDHKVAIKFLLPELLANPEAVARFVREARAAVKITSEHVARVTDVGRLDNGAPYMVMEFLEGGDLADWLRTRGPLPVDQAVDFVLQACVAVADAHGLGIVHRDLKPANLFCVRRSDGQLLIKVLDFGISKATGAARASEPPSISMTQTSAVMGSPLYMSPEQVQDAKGVDARTDLWALGVILYELLAGVVPFPGETFGELAVKISVQPPPPLRSYRPDVAPELEAVVMRCLEKDRERRFRNVAEVSHALLPFAPRRSRVSVERVAGIIQAAGLSPSALALPPPPPVDRTMPAAGTFPPVGRAAVSGVSRSRGPLVAFGATVILLAVVGAVALLRSSIAGRPPVTAPPVVDVPSVQGAATVTTRAPSEPAVLLATAATAATSLTATAPPTIVEAPAPQPVPTLSAVPPVARPKPTSAPPPLSPVASAAATPALEPPPAPPPPPPSSATSDPLKRLVPKR